MLRQPLLLQCLCLSLVLSGCASTSDDDTYIDTETGKDADTGIPGAYLFTDASGESTVSYSGQIARHALLAGLKDWMSGITSAIDDGSYQPDSAEGLLVDIDFYFKCADSLCDDLVVGDDSTSETSLRDIATGKNLVGKIAGNDAVTDHKNWTSGDFKGWSGATSPEALLAGWFDVLAEQAVSRVNGDLLKGPNGELIESVYLTPEGHDIAQLTEKFLLGALAFSQGTDDYLDDDVDGKGLLASHGPSDEGKVYTELEHAWDEGFGYFGAARNYLAYTDLDVADNISIDMDGDGMVDLVSEKNWGHSLTAGKRDNAAVVATDFTAQAWEGFASGRALLSATAGTELTDSDFMRLQGYRDTAVSAWENAIAATVVHCINDVLQDMGKMGTLDYSFSAHAKHWSELKGFALGLQFNPASSLIEADFESLHMLLGDAPVLATASVDELLYYGGALVEARTLIGDAYDFNIENMGDAGGEGGW